MVLVKVPQEKQEHLQRANEFSFENEVEEYSSLANWAFGLTPLFGMKFLFSRRHADVQIS